MFAIMDWKSFVIGVLTSLVATGVIACAKGVFLWFWNARSPLTGKWTDRIYDENGHMVKSDTFTLRHNLQTHVVTGSIKRTYPSEQSHRKWRVRGVLHGDHMSLVCWSKDPTLHDGSMFLRMVDDFRYEGYYLRVGDGGDIDIIRIDLCKMERNG